MRDIISGMTISAVLLVVGTCVADAQVPNLDPSRIRPGVDTLTMSDGGFVVDEIVVVDMDGRSVLRRVYRSNDLDKKYFDSLFVDAATLIPVRAWSSGRHDIRFGIHRAVGWRKLLDDSTTVDRPLPGNAYVDGTLDLVLRSAPLSPEWKGTVELAGPYGNGIVTARARVLDVEVINGAPAWRVEVHGSPYLSHIGILNEMELVNGAWRARTDQDSLATTMWIDTLSRGLVKKIERLRIFGSLIAKTTFTPRRSLAPMWPEGLRHAGGPPLGAPPSDYRGRVHEPHDCISAGSWWEATERSLRLKLSADNEWGAGWRKALGDAPLIKPGDVITLITDRDRCSFAAVWISDLRAEIPGTPPVVLAQLPDGSYIAWPSQTTYGEFGAAVRMKRLGYIHAVALW